MVGRTFPALINQVKEPGKYCIAWDAAQMPSGVYFYRMTAGRYSHAKKMLLLK